jgi:hypothetical protein
MRGSILITQIQGIPVIQPQHSVSHFIQQIQSGETTRSRKQQMPNWLQAFVWQAADHFDPIGGTARAGYIATHEDNRWIVRLFLGETEVVGGSRDGAIVPAAFTVDLEALRDSFEAITRLEWHGLPAGSLPAQTRDEATIAVDGIVSGHVVRLLVDLRSPADMGPGLKRQADGTYLPA